MSSIRNRSKTSRVEISAIFSQVYPGYSEEKETADKARVIKAIKRCRTAELGGHRYHCKNCDYIEHSYNSCLNRHCPKCQGSEAFKWVQDRQEELLPVPYFHLVYTLPETVRELCFQNKRIFYDLLLKSSSEALQKAIQARYGAKSGAISILHTWNQEMLYHPHAHQIVPAAGITPDNKAIILGKQNFLVSVRVLSKLFRGIFISHLKQAYSNNKLKYFNNLLDLANPINFEHLISKSAKHDWVVYSKAPFAGPQRLLKYLANYTHRICISNKRVLSLTKDEVRIKARGIKQKHKKRIIKLTPKEFTRRYLLHLIPKAQRRIRYHGILYNQKRKEHTELIRSQLPAATRTKPKPDKPHPKTCPKCKQCILEYQPLIKPHKYRRKPSCQPPSLPKIADSFALEPPLSYYLH